METKKVIIYKYKINHSYTCSYCDCQENYSIIKSNIDDIKIGQFITQCRNCNANIYENVSMDQISQIEKEIETNTKATTKTETIKKPLIITQPSGYYRFLKYHISETKFMGLSLTVTHKGKSTAYTDIIINPTTLPKSNFDYNYGYVLLNTKKYPWLENLYALTRKVFHKVNDRIGEYNVYSVDFRALEYFTEFSRYVPN